MNRKTSAGLSRREFLAAGVATSGVAALLAAGSAAAQVQGGAPQVAEASPRNAYAGAGHSDVHRLRPHGRRRRPRAWPMAKTAVSSARSTWRTSIRPSSWRTSTGGRRAVTADGRTVREWDVFAADKEIEVAPGVFFPAWTYNGQVPGPTFRCRQGDLLAEHTRPT